RRRRQGQHLADRHAAALPGGSETVHRAEADQHRADVVAHVVRSQVRLDAELGNLRRNAADGRAAAGAARSARREGHDRRAAVHGRDEGSELEKGNHERHEEREETRRSFCTNAFRVNWLLRVPSSSSWPSWLHFGEAVMNRREFMAGAGTLAIAARPLFAATQTAARSGVFPASVRADFPSVARETYLNSAAIHPVGTFAAEAMKSL